MTDQSPSVSSAVSTIAPETLQKGAQVLVRTTFEGSDGWASLGGIRYKCYLVGELRDAMLSQRCAEWKCEVLADAYPAEGIWHVSVKPLMPADGDQKESLKDQEDNFRSSLRSKGKTSGRKTSRNCVRRQQGRR